MNKRIFFLSFVAVLLSAAAKAASADTIHAEQFGILPYTYENQTVKMQEALNGCKEQGAKVLAFRPGRYDFWSEGAVRKEFFMTTPRKVVIADNTYYKTGMSAILIEGDAEGWYESGPVNDVLIENNSFIECAFNGGPAGAVIALNPSNRIVDANRPVHRNVRIIGNRFRTFGNPLLFAKSTQGLTFRDNTVTYSPEVKNQPKLFLLNGCKDVCIEKNLFPTPLAKEQTQTSNMP